MKNLEIAVIIVVVIAVIAVAVWQQKKGTGEEEEDYTMYFLKKSEYPYEDPTWPAIRKGSGLSDPIYLRPVLTNDTVEFNVPAEAVNGFGISGLYESGSYTINKISGKVQELFGIDSFLKNQVSTKPFTLKSTQVLYNGKVLADSSTRKTSTQGFTKDSKGLVKFIVKVDSFKGSNITGFLQYRF